MRKTKDLLIRLISVFILSKKKRHDFLIKFLSKYTLPIRENHIFYIDEKGNKKPITHQIKGLKIIKDKRYESSDNTILISDRAEFSSSKIILKGSKNHIHLGSGKYHDFYLHCNSSDFSTGDDFSCGGVIFWMCDEKNATVKIGKNVMLSWDIEFFVSGWHAIIKNNEKFAYNGLTSPLEIGNNVWIGCHAKILKNANIPDNTIIGLGSVVTKKFTQPNSIIAGNPATVLKTNYGKWDRLTPEQYNLEIAKSDIENKN